MQKLEKSEGNDLEKKTIAIVFGNALKMNVSKFTTKLQLTSLVNLSTYHSHSPEENEFKRDALKQKNHSIGCKKSYKKFCGTL